VATLLCVLLVCLAAPGFEWAGDMGTPESIRFSFPERGLAGDLSWSGIPPFQRWEWTDGVWKMVVNHVSQEPNQWVLYEWSGSTWIPRSLAAIDGPKFLPWMMGDTVAAIAIYRCVGVLLGLWFFGRVVARWFPSA